MTRVWVLELDYPDKERAIWTRRLNWGAQVCEQATLADLDPQAIAETRRQYAEKNKTKLTVRESRELPDGTLFPVELTQYNPWVIREALHNCIAHQDYGLHGRILDMRYTRLLMAQGELDLGTIILLDKVPKGQRIDADGAKRRNTFATGV